MEEKVIEILKNNEAMRPGEIAEKLGIDKKDLDKVIKKLKAEDKIYSPKRCFYSVK
ncbi:MAG: MarR family transcriptional regulator [Fusobacteriaceae bacterium]|jgi:DNA-binding MarR family transcriptional regulator|nr:MarR family transcriptional regulator [Fusobacteriaceae bacterium]